MRTPPKVFNVLNFIDYLDITAHEAQLIIQGIEGKTFREDEGEEPEDLYDRMEAENGQY